MKKLLAILLCMILLCMMALAEDDSQARIDSGIVGVWIETEGEGTLTMRADGTSTMDYYSIISDANWELTEDGGRFIDGMWMGCSIVMVNENCLSVDDGWMLFTREGVDVDMSEIEWLALDPVPVGEEGAPFLGVWKLEGIEMDGATMPPALMGLEEMSLTLTEDGLVTLYDGVESMLSVWYVEDGAAIVDGMPMTLREDGKLVMEEDGAAMVFALGETAENADEMSEEELLWLLLGMMASTEEESELPEEHQAFVGDWLMCYCAADDLTGDLRILGCSASLTLYEDYTGSLWCYPSLEGEGKLLQDVYGDWFEEDGTLYFGERRIPLCILGDETASAGVFLRYGTDENYLIFSQDENAVWDPEAYALQPAAGAADASDRLDIRYVCKQYTAVGQTYDDVSVLGGEYSVIFYPDGKADFTMAGAALPTLPYTINENGEYVVDYNGFATYTFVPTDAGFDLDYYGAMMLHMVPEN